ncbi:MAG: RimK family alpha-L-glutamate ligase [Vulcanimicrobiota bacterium]
MKQVGFLASQDEPFLSDLMKSLIETGEKMGEEIKVELCRIPELRLDRTPPYDLILDRISHVMPYYLQFCKQAVLNGTYVINNPFRFYVDKYFGFAVAKELGVSIPRTALLPPRKHPDGLDEHDLVNMVFPLDWKDILGYVGFPAFLKPAGGWGWRDVYKVHNMEELMYYYHLSGKELMLLQENIDYDHYVRCFCLGRKYTMPIKYHPYAALHEKYVIDHNHLTPEQGEKVHRFAVTLSDALDFDMNVCEFAFRNGEPIAIDFTNMVPDVHPESIRWHYYNWVIETLAKVIVEYLEKPGHPQMWKSLDRYLENPEEMKV